MADSMTGAENIQDEHASPSVLLRDLLKYVLYQHEGDNKKEEGLKSETGYSIQGETNAMQRS